MKIAKILFAVLSVALVISFSGAAVAQDKVADTAVKAAEEVVGNVVEEVTMTGTVEKEGEGLVLKGETETCKLLGEVDEALVGKKVEAIGVAAEVDGVKILTVKTITAVE